MATLIEKFLQLYLYVDSFSDPLVKDWYLLRTPYLPLAVWLTYVLFVVYVGPKFMKDRKPYSLIPLTVAYNATQIFFNAYLCIKVAQYVWESPHQFRCYNIEPYDTPTGIRVRNIFWLFVIDKTLDLFDTVLFVLRKKQHLVTFLHVYHHTLAFSGGWASARYYPGGPAVVFGILNSFVHSVHYTYYLLTLKPETRKLGYTVKKYVTQLQILHLTLSLIYGIRSFTDKACKLPSVFFWVGFSQVIVMIILFANFYMRLYLERNSEKWSLANKNGHKAEITDNKKEK